MSLQHQVTDTYRYSPIFDMGLAFWHWFRTNKLIQLLREHPKVGAGWI